MTTVFHKNSNIIKWKGHTINEVTPSLHINKPTTTNIHSNLFFKPLPLKIYRNEIANKDTNCNSKISIKIKNYEIPKGSIVSENNLGVTTTTINTHTDSCLEPTCEPFLSAEKNALRRLRSNGRINNYNNGNKKYFTNNQQYLNNRTKSYEKNNYQYAVSLEDNTYRSNNVTDCSNTIHYNPSNSRFSVQGAVSSGDLITRKKYETITTVGDSYRTAYGNPTANALAYGVPSYGYTIKDKIGYPIKKTPVFPKFTNEMRTCRVRTLKNAI